MALTSLLWISISLWPARKREDEKEREGVRGGEGRSPIPASERGRGKKERGVAERKTGPPPRSSSSSALASDLGPLPDPKDVKHEKKAERRERARTG